ncbi:MAG: glycosyl transferase family protein, partial [uncultured bacterium]
WPNMSWSEGKIQFTKGGDKSKAVFSAWASGGSAIFSRKIWDKLGGLDEIYAPWYWEDIDIGYRAWKSGYKIIWDPNCNVIHDHESTSKKLNPQYVSLIKQRNELIFNWLNVTDKNFVFGHFAFLVKHTLSHPGYLKIVLFTLWHLMFHKTLKRKFIFKDRDILKLFSQAL